MRICVAHETSFSYATPASGIIQTLRLTPRNHIGQYVVDWRVDVSADCRLDTQEDAFGNIVHAFSADGPVTALRLMVDGEVETQEMDGIVRGAMERFPPNLFLRETALTHADEAILAYAAEFANSDASPGPDMHGHGNDGTLSILHAVLARLHEDIAHGGADDAEFADPVTAAEAFARKRGRSEDLAHVFIAVARALGVPTRCISGYFSPLDRAAPQDCGHAWVEAHVPGLGWVGFDPANGLCVTDRHVRVAMGLDYLGAAPVRSAHYGGTGEAQAVKLTVNQGFRQVQS
jgi:transglutaminase-like putative cysteine protease